MIVMILGKLRGMPTHTDIITDFDFREVSTVERWVNASREHLEGWYRLDCKLRGDVFLSAIAQQCAVVVEQVAAAFERSQCFTLTIPRIQLP